MRGVICVERMVRGQLQWLPLADQHHYKEWTGCFSLLGTSLTNNDNNSEN
jgi:hypothetical protein